MDKGRKVMTEKLFYNDVRKAEFEATVVSCVKNKDRYEVVLDGTYFYPEGGGQPADHGKIDDANVFDVHDKDNEVVHYCDKEVECGKKVKAWVDMERRHRLMQQHSGEHIVSGLIHKHFGYDNVGFHMGSDCITIDFNGPLTADDLKLVEKEANEAIYRNFDTNIFYPSPEELEKLEYRSKKALEGDVRIVNFKDCDTCACCGLHVVKSGEIGIIKITGSQNYKGGTRVTMLAGKQAWEDYAVKDSIVHGISNLLSAKPYETKEAVEKLMKERNEIKEQLVAAKKQIFELKRDSVKDDETCAVFFEENMEPFELRLFTEMLLEKVPSAAVFSGNDEEGYKYAVGSTKTDMSAFIKEANKALGGRGGGRGNIMQGAFTASRDETERYIRNGLA
jgi:alanyl-tRNA synthetase